MQDRETDGHRARKRDPRAAAQAEAPAETMRTDPDAPLRLCHATTSWTMVDLSGHPRRKRPRKSDTHLTDV